MKKEYIKIYFSGPILHNYNNRIPVINIVKTSITTLILENKTCIDVQYLVKCPHTLKNIDEYIRQR